MAEKTAIGWTDSTFNPWTICTPVGPGCDGCYAKAMMHRFGKEYRQGVPRERTSAAYWRQPLKWNRQPFCECMNCGWRGESREGVTVENPPGFHPPLASMTACPKCKQPMLKEARRRVFCASLSDVFDNEVDPAWRRDLFDLIELTPNLDWLIVTKRIGNVFRMVADARTHDWLQGRKNVRLLITVVNQEEADRDIPKLLAIGCPKTGISYEPAIGPIDWAPWLDIAWSPTLRRYKTLNGLNGSCKLEWVIIGGESNQAGHKARPFYAHWMRDTVAQCCAARVPVFVKQMGSFVIDRNDAGFDGCDPASWPLRPDGCDPELDFEPHGHVENYQGADCRIKLVDRAGANPAEWPEALRVQEFP